VLDDQLDVDPVRREIVEHAVIRFAIDTPEPCPGNISDARRELEPEQMEYPEYRVGIAGRIGHDLGRPQFGFLVEHDRQQMKTVARCAGDRHGIQPGKAVGNQIIPGDAAFAPKVPRVRTGVDGANRHSRSPSGDATSPPPQARVRGILLCAATSSALAVVSVPARMKFCFTQLNRDRRRAGTSGRRSGSKPVPVASATSTAQIVVAMSPARALPSLA
jgi:hypothetical protein